jgi:hypothetical protein
MNELKENMDKLGLPQYTEKIVIAVSKTDSVTKYLLFTQISVYLGMSLPTSAILFFVVNYLTNSKVKKDPEPIVEAEPVVIIKKVEPVDKSFYSYLFGSTTSP